MAPATAAYTLTAKSGYVFTPDGNSIYMWGYAGPSGAFQLPGPILCVNEGDTVSVTLNNTLADPVSVVFPGQSAVLADGQPDAPALAAVPPTMAKPAPKLTGSVDLLVRGLARRVPTSTRVAPTSASRCRWACTGR